MNRNQGRHAEAALVLFTHFGARAFRRDHHHGDVFTHLLTHFNDVEAVGVTQRRAVFHQRLHRAHYGRVLLVRRQVDHQIRLRDQVFVGADLEAVFGRLAREARFSSIASLRRA